MSALLEDLFADRPPGYDRLIDGPYSQSALLREMNAVRAEIAAIDRKWRKTRADLDHRDGKLWPRYAKLLARYSAGH